MMQGFERELCAAYCEGLEVHPVPSGFAVSSAFLDGSGDKLTFYVSETEDGFRIEDDGDYLASLVAADVRIDLGTRGQMLDAILAEGGAYWDRASYEIRSDAFAKADLGKRSIAFLSSLIRVRDLELVTRDRVKSAFREDFLRAITEKYAGQIVIGENVAPANDLDEFPADVVIKPLRSGGMTGAIYLVNTTDKLNEALLAWRELEDYPAANVAMMAVLEEPDLRQINRRKWQRAQNRGLPMPVFRGDENGMLGFIGKRLNLAS